MKKFLIIVFSLLALTASGVYIIIDTVNQDKEYSNSNYKVEEKKDNDSNNDNKEVKDNKENKDKKENNKIVEKEPLSLSNPVETLKVGNSSAIKITNLLNDKVKSYKSSNSKIVTVTNDGKVTAVGIGKATITIETINGRKGTYNVVVINESSKVVEVSKIELNKTSVSINEGDKISLTTVITPANATNKNITWKSSNNSIATVSNGIVEGKKEGTVEITASSNNGKTSTCKVVVIKKSNDVSYIPVEKITLNNTNISITENGQALLMATITPSNATNKKLTWTSSNTTVASVTNGLVTGIKEGTAIISAKSENGIIAKANITVKKNQTEVSDIPVTGISLNKTSVTVNVGKSTSLVVAISPSDATNKNITWTSSNTAVATVSNGTITGKGEGYATITAKSSNGKTATCSVKVEKENIVIDVTGLTLNKTTASLKIGDSITLVPTLSPSNATNQTITWTSSNDKIATVKNGVVTSKRSGTVTITAASNNGKKATCKVTISGSRIHFIKPESQSDVALLESNGKFALIDTSTYSSRSAVKKYLDNLGVTDIEFLIVSHNHSDHLGAAKYLSTKFNIKKLYIKKYLANDNKEGQDLIDSKTRYNNTISAFDGKVVYVDSNSKFKETTSGSGYVTLGDMKVYFFNTKQRMEKLPSGTTNKYPGYYKVSYYAGSSENHNSLVNLVEVNGHYALMAGDMELFSVMKDIFTDRINGKISKIDIFKLPHHATFNCFGSYAYPTKVSYTLSASVGYYVITGLMDRKLDDGTYYRTPNKVMVNGVAKNSCMYSMAKGDEAKAKKIMCNAYYTLDTSNGMIFNLTYSTVTVSGGVQGKSVSSRCK